jgi:long-chain acyl-CoA synthetase
VQRELAAIGARVAIVAPAGRQAFAGVQPDQLPALQHVIVAKSPEGDQVGLDGLLASEPAPIVPREQDDLAVLIFTSGTAGSPKAAMLSHGNLLSNIEQCQGHPGRAQTPDDIVFGVLPFFHIFGLNVALGLSLSAGSAILAVERFDPHSSLESIATHKVTVVSGAPTMWGAWATLPGADGSALATVRLAASGAAKLPIETKRAIHDRFGLDLTEGYGLTEASPVVTTATGMVAPEGSIGVPVPGQQIRLVDADGQDALVGDPGEIWVRGPNVFHGYWNDAEATTAALDSDGWLHTGDVAVVDDDGFLYLVDRVKDLIIVSGFNVYPAEVEEVIATHPSVEQVAVVGVPHPYSGEAVKAYVVTASGQSIEEDDVISFCEARLARYKCPQKVLFVDELPQGSTGKVLRRALR